MFKMKFAYKLYIPIVMISVIVGVFAINIRDISSLINKEMKVASIKELKLAKDIKYIKNTLIDMKSSMVQSIVDKKVEDKNLFELRNKFLSVKKVLNKIKKSSYFQTKDRQQILKNLEARINGQYSILREMPEDFSESFEDGTYSIISLSAITKKLSIELEKLQMISKNILDNRVYQIVKNKVEFYLLVLGISLFSLFIFTHFLDKQILLSIEKLKRLNHSLLLFVKNKTERVEEIDLNKISNDDVGKAIKDISDTVNYVEEIIAEDRELKQEIEDTQREIIFTMGAIGESRSKETGDHVKRVAEYSYLLAKLYGLSDEESTLIKEASPMHDIGKVAIPDSILKKPGKLTDEEFKIMQTHSQLGYDMLKHSDRPILKAASIIAHQHHEKYNGRGYPQGLKGDEIHIYGVITAVTDVFDALGSDRVYKKAWSDEKIINLFIEETGEHFHPVLANLFLAHFDEFVNIRDRYKDEFEKEGEKEKELA